MLEMNGKYNDIMGYNGIYFTKMIWVCLQGGYLVVMLMMHQHLGCSIFRQTSCGLWEVKRLTEITFRPQTNDHDQ